MANTEDRLDRLIELLHGLVERKRLARSTVEKKKAKIPWSRKDWPAIACLYLFYFWFSGTWGSIPLWLTYGDNETYGQEIFLGLVLGIAAAILLPIGMYFIIVMMRGLRTLMYKLDDKK